MKKIIAITIFLSICLTFIYGCSNATTPTAVAKKIDKNLNTLYTAVSNLDTIDNSYIANPDIYNIENISQTSTIKKAIASPPRSTAKKIEMEDTSIPLKVDEETTNESNNYDNQELSSQHKNLENKKNITHENDQDNNIEYSNEEKMKTNIDVIFEDEINTESNLNDVLIIDEDGNGTLIDEEGEVVEDTNKIPQDKLDEIFESTINDENLTKEKKEKVYIFLFDKIRYTPRYANNYNTEIAQTTLNNYLYKVQELYTMTADVVEANNVLADEKNELLNCIENLKTINNKMIAGEITPNNQQLIALNNYVQDIKTTIKRIKSSNGQLNNEINNISTTSSNYGLSKGVDIINSNYLKILNHIDARITYFKSAIATLDQIHYILNEAQLELNYNFNEKENDVEINKNLIPEEAKNIDTYNTNNTTKIPNENNAISKNNTNIDSFKSNLKNNNSNTYNSIYDINKCVNDNKCNNVAYDYAINATDLNNNLNNNLNNLPNNSNNINTPNGTFQNGIITQNNLNNGINNGINGTHSGYTNSNGNVDYFKQNNINRTDKNINTYGQNSLIDMINNGTVNNGINTLNIENKDTATKPVMVDNLLDEIDKIEDKNLAIENVKDNNFSNSKTVDSAPNSTSNISQDDNIKSNENENIYTMNENLITNNCNDCANKTEQNINTSYEQNIEIPNDTINEIEENFIDEIA